VLPGHGDGFAMPARFFAVVALSNADPDGIPLGPGLLPSGLSRTRNCCPSLIRHGWQTEPVLHEYS
jgi:hypothetical protein